MVYFRFIYDPIKNRAAAEEKNYVFLVWIRAFAPVERFKLHVLLFSSVFSVLLLLIFHMHYVRQLRVQSAHTTRCAKCAEERGAAQETVCRGTWRWFFFSLVEVISCTYAHAEFSCSLSLFIVALRILINGAGEWARKMLENWTNIYSNGDKQYMHKHDPTVCQILEKKTEEAECARFPR